jgi:hypothetical protein
MTKGYFEFEYLKRRDLKDEVQKVVQNYFNIYNSVTGTVDYFANLPSASANLNKIWLVRFATTFLGIITKQAGLYISDGTNWNWMTNLEAKAEKNTTISAGNGLTGGGDLSANRTISHSDTSSQVNVVNTGGNVLQSANLDDFGHITSFSSIDLDNRYITTSGAYANPTWITSLDANKLTGTIPSNVLGASTVYIGTTAIALNRASGNLALTGISSVQFTGATSGTATIQAPAVAGTTTFTLPTTSGNLITDQQYTANDVLTKIKTVDGTGSGLDADTLEGIPLGTTAGNNGVEWPSVPFIKFNGIIEAGRCIDFHASSLEAQDYTARLDAGASTTVRVLTLPLETGTLISSGGLSVVSNTMLAGSITDSKLTTITTAGKVANSATTATNLNTASSIVARDASGNFNAGTITGALSGNSTTATTLQTARTINGVSFNGSADITVEDNTKLPLVGGTLTGRLISTTANNTGTGLGQIYLNGATGNRIDFNNNGLADPAFTTRSVGTKVVLFPAVSGVAVDYAFGMGNSTLWYSVSNTGNQHRFFAGTTSVARIRNDGLQTRANLYEGNAAFTVLNTTATLTIAQILTLVIESTPTANITFTLPTGTNTDAGVMSSLETFASFTWSIVNIATGFTITIAGNTGNTYIGNTTIAANTAASFRTQKTAANTFKTVRI